jgi:hypothetical protein
MSTKCRNIPCDSLVFSSILEGSDLSEVEEVIKEKDVGMLRRLPMLGLLYLIPDPGNAREDDDGVVRVEGDGGSTFSCGFVCSMDQR